MSESVFSEGGIDYIELPANDFDAVEAFYSRVFGWTFVDWGEDYRAFNDGRLDGGFFKSPLSSGQDDGAPLIIFRTAHLEKLEASVVAAGGAIVKPIFAFPGGRRFHFTDPCGNELAVWTDS